MSTTSTSTRSTTPVVPVLPRPITCKIDQDILNENSLQDMNDIGLSFFASVCGKNRGAFVLDPPDGNTYGWYVYVFAASLSFLFVVMFFSRVRVRFEHILLGASFLNDGLVSVRQIFYGKEGGRQG